MAIIICADCKKPMLKNALSCPKCGKPNEKLATVNPRKVSLLLAIGIFFIPYIFAWFTLRKGYSVQARIISGLWLVIAFAIVRPRNQEDMPVSAPVVAATPAQVESKIIKKSLLMTPEMLRNDFNKIAPAIDKSYFLNAFNIEAKGSMDMFKYNISENLSIAGSVNKDDGMLRELVIMEIKHNADNLNTNVVLDTVINILNSSTDKTKNEQLVISLVDEAINNKGKTVDRLFDNFKYSAISSDDTYLWFVIQPNIPNVTNDLSVTVEKSINITPAQFKQDFNNFVMSINSRYLLPDFSIKNGDVYNTFNPIFSEGLGVLGTVDKNTGKIHELTIILAGKNNDSLEAIVVILASAHVLNIGIAKEENSRIIREMIDTLVKTKSKQEVRIVGKLKYTAMANDGMGLWFSFSANE
jgi:hypothetical protein